MTATLHALAWALVLRDEYRPHRLAKTVAGVTWELISYPWADGDGVRVLVRVPGDPTTLIEVDALDLTPEGQGCACHNGVKPEFYFVDSPADAARRALDVAFLTRQQGVR